ncbi:hypothetical protein OIU77_025096 [Salix suchowensis]|uniref:Uncharacterized protein n=1 Tax=Salix suchowensis TaxID=1278906 RepID=A0ABQ9BXW4_9ROSI|nr:hypothetical protein OIU77_025096 [Salix suchowensis]
MGSSSSRLDGSTPSGSGSGTNRLKRRALAPLFCGGSVYQSPVEMGDRVDESLTGSLENLATFPNVRASFKQASSSNFGSETGLSSSSADSGDLSGSSSGNVEDNSALKNSESQSQQVNTTDSIMEAHAVNASVKELTPTAPVSDDTAVAGVLGQDSGSLDSNGESISDANMDLYSTNSAIPASLVSPQPCPEFQSSDREREARAARVLVVDVDLMTDGSLILVAIYISMELAVNLDILALQRERFHDVRDEQGWETYLCPAGLHPNGTCSCEPSSVADESRSRASISQITLLADALFEVLEEIHHHRLSLSPSMLSLPAPEAVVHSFPLKNYTKVPGK